MSSHNGHDGSEKPRTIRSDEGTWLFLPQEPLRLGARHSWSALMMVRTPTGQIIDLYLPVGRKPDQVSDGELLSRAKKVLSRSL